MVKDVTDEYPSYNTGTIKDISQRDGYVLVEEDCLIEAVAAAAATTRYLNVSVAGVVSLDAAATVMPANYMLVITSYAATCGTDPDDNDVYMYDGTNAVYYENGADQFVHQENASIVQGPGYHLVFYGALAATTTLLIHVSYKLYLIEGAVLETNERTAV